jgi:hypothetical protein
MQEGLAVLKPHLIQTNVKSEGKAVIGTVRAIFTILAKTSSP